MTRALIITITAVIALCAFSAGGVSAHPAWGIVVDRNNQIYFSDLETVWRVDAQGKLTVFRAGVGGRHTHDLNMDEARKPLRSGQLLRTFHATIFQRRLEDDARRRL